MLQQLVVSIWSLWIAATPGRKVYNNSMTHRMAFLAERYITMQ